MPQRLHLEGSDPHELLVRAREQYGPHVTVVRAERVRTGGVMGFFARETYELTLEVPDASLAIDADGSRPAIGAGTGAGTSGAGASGAPSSSTPTSAALAAEIADAQALREEMFAGSAPVAEVADVLAEASGGSPASGASAQESAPTSAEEFRRALEEFTLPERPVGARGSAESPESGPNPEPGQSPESGASQEPSHAVGSGQSAGPAGPGAAGERIGVAETQPGADPEVSAAAVAGAIREFMPAAFPAADPDAVVLPTVRPDERRELSGTDVDPGADAGAIVIPQLAPAEDSPLVGRSRAATGGDEAALGYVIPQLAPEEGPRADAPEPQADADSVVAAQTHAETHTDAHADAHMEPRTGADTSARAGVPARGVRRSPRRRSSVPPIDRPASAGSDEERNISVSEAGSTAARPAGRSSAVESAAATSAAAPVAERAPSPSRERSSTPTIERSGEGVVLHRWGVQADLTDAVQTGSTVAELLALGVPPRLLGERLVLADRVPLLDIVARLGVPTQRRLEPGELLVVVGAPVRAREVAAQVVAWMGLPEQSLVLGGECEAVRGHGRRVRTVQAAKSVRHRATQAGSEGVATVVALGVAPGRRGAVAAVPMLDALGADASWAAVDASEAYGSAAALEPLAAGAHLDAIAAMGVSRSQAPAALLDASLPVAWMDGLPASPVVWAALLAERLSEPR